MAKTNAEVVRGYIEEVLNQKHFDRFMEFCDEDCIIHNPPYAGLGFYTDDTSGEKIVLTHIAAHGPADGHLQVGDELVRIKDGDQIWETFDEIRNGFWGQGVIASELTVTVHRHGNVLTIPLKRGKVEGFNTKLTEVIDPWCKRLLKEWSDIRIDIQMLCGEGDMVTCYGINSGTNIRFNRSAIWSEIDIFKLKNGKIIDMWSIESIFDELKQLGYQITEPVRELA